MARLVTIPCAVAVERAPVRRGVVGDTEPVDGRARVNLTGVRAIYRGTASTGAPAACVELGDVLWRFLFDSDELADHWTARLVRIVA